MSTKPLAIIIGENIVNLRKSLKLSQKELAVKLGISYEAMSRIENGKTSPKISRLQELADILECPVSAMFQDTSLFNNKALERAKILNELIATLSEESQEAVMDIVYASVKALKKK